MVYIMELYQSWLDYSSGINLVRSRSDRDRRANNKERNKYVELLKKAKRNYFSNLSTKCVADKKKFWKRVKFFLKELRNYSRKLFLSPLQK